MQYRNEINGLRAIAVLAVILFHTELPLFRGGYAGVDIFFFISGYLIFGLLQNGLSLREFYLRRARRILPVYFFVLAATIPIAWMLLLPEALMEYGKSLFTSTLFVSNIAFWKEANYFATLAALKPLIHTWSLGVEIQYYLIFPILLKFLKQNAPKRLSFWLGIICFSSLAIAQFCTHAFPEFSFYMLPTRLWEFLLGALLFLHEDKIRNLIPPRLQSACVALALCGIIAFIRIAQPNWSHPGLIVLWPLTCAFFIITFSSSYLSRYILGSRALVLCGLMSFSLYMWHQPILAFLRAAKINAPEISDMVFALMATIILSYASWRWIEQPWRKVISLRLFLKGSIILLIINLAAGALFWHYGFSDRYPKQVYAPFEEVHRNTKIANEKLRSDCRPRDVANHCILGDVSATPEWAIVGDSHAAAMTTALDQALEERHLSAWEFTQVTCAYAPGLQLSSGETRKDCLNRNASVRKRLLQPDIKFIILTGRYVSLYHGTYFNNGEGGIEKQGLAAPHFAAAKEDILIAYQNAVRELLTAGKTVYLIYPVPEPGWHVPETIAKLRMHNVHAELGYDAKTYYERVAPVTAAFDAIGAHPRLIRIHPDKVFCAHKASPGRCVVANENEVYFSDTDHLSFTGAERLLREIFD